jgi:SAM-dependent methyltransferase
MLFNNPLSSERADELVRLLELSPGDRVLDSGCGQGEFLLRAIEATGCAGWGIDRDAECIAAARQTASSRVPAALAEFRVADMGEIALEPASFAACICLGSTHAFGSGDRAFPGALAAFSRLVRPGGRVLIGEGYWKQPPAPEYLELIGEPVGIYHDHAGNIDFAARLGWTTCFAAESSFQEWDAFESAHLAKIERQAAAAPGDAALAARLARSQGWYAGYERWGRTTMGFGFYVLST